MDTTSKKIP